jgi:hypothetical protein
MQKTPINGFERKLSPTVLTRLGMRFALIRHEKTAKIVIFFKFLKIETVFAGANPD